MDQHAIMLAGYDKGLKEGIEQGIEQNKKAIFEKLLNGCTKLFMFDNKVASLPILIGNNIATTVTAVLAAFGGKKKKKKTALFHIFVNFIGTAPPRKQSCSPCPSIW